MASVSLSATVVISTLGRPQGCARAVRSVLEALGPTDRLLVVDQSADDATALELDAMLRGDARMSYLRSDRRGISAGHNLGAQHARSDLLLFTDDDCTVSPAWVDEWRKVFARDGGVGIGFGTVACAPFEPGTGFTPHFEPQHSDRHGREVFGRVPGSIGMGANTAVLGLAWALAGGCDECLGVGTRFGGAEEIDLAYRIVRSGFRLAHAAEPVVIHDGFRPGEAASALVQSNALGTGAMYAKHLRCGDLFALRLLTTEIVRSLAQIVSRVMTNRRPLGLRRLKSIAIGVAGSRTLKIDRRLRLYVSPAERRGRAQVQLQHH